MFKDLFDKGIDVYNEDELTIFVVNESDLISVIHLKENATVIEQEPRFNEKFVVVE